MHVTDAQELALREWEAFDKAHPAPTFTARPAWARAWCEANNGVEPMPMRCTFDDGGSLIVPLIRERTRFGWRVATGMPWNESIVILGSNGHIAGNERCVTALRFIASRVASGSLTITLWPLCAQGEICMDGTDRRDEVSVIDLADGAEAAIERIDGRTRRMAGQAARKGVTCSRADPDGDLNVYFGILEDAAKRWGRDRPTITRALLEGVFAHAGNDAELWLAYYNRNPIAGGVVLYGGSQNHEMYFWSAAMRGDSTQLRPSNALNLTLIRAAAERGARWYNMGSSFGLPGVAEFKDRLGARRVGYRTQSLQSPLYRAYTAIRAAVHLG